MGPDEAALFGVILADPLGPWPTSHTDPALSWVDHDGDGNIGVTSYLVLEGDSAVCEMPYAGLPIPETGDRAAEVYLASRSIARLQGEIESCDLVRGSMAGPDDGRPLLQGRVAGCTRTDGGACTDAEVDSLDLEAGNAAQRILDSRFTIVRVSDDITCDEVRNMAFP